MRANFYLTRFRSYATAEGLSGRLLDNYRSPLECFWTIANGPPSLFQIMTSLVATVHVRSLRAFGITS